MRRATVKLHDHHVIWTHVFGKVKVHEHTETYVFKDPDVAENLSTIQNKYVDDPANKSSNNIAHAFI